MVWLTNNKPNKEYEVSTLCALNKEILPLKTNLYIKN